MILGLWKSKKPEKAPEAPKESKPATRPARSSAKKAESPIPCYAYILKLESGNFYFGHAEDLREKMLEYRDGGATAEIGKNAKLQYFEMLPSREAAMAREADLKKLTKQGHREVLRAIRGFHDLVGELEFH